MDYMDVLYGIDNPLFLDLKNNPEYVFKTILPWAFKYLLTAPKIAKLRKPVDEYLAGFPPIRPCWTSSPSTSSRRPRHSSR